MPVWHSLLVRQCLALLLSFEERSYSHVGCWTRTPGYISLLLRHQRRLVPLHILRWCVNASPFYFSLPYYSFLPGKYLASINLCGSILTRSIRQRRSTLLTLDKSARRRVRGSDITMRLNGSLTHKNSMSGRLLFLKESVGRNHREKCKAFNGRTLCMLKKRKWL